jgi:hypothetical protein
LIPIALQHGVSGLAINDNNDEGEVEQHSHHHGLHLTDQERARIADIKPVRDGWHSVLRIYVILWGLVFRVAIYFMT